MAHTSHSSVLYCLPLREGDRGSRVTLVGLGANVLLTSAKGAAGWYVNSAALLADAGHSLSGKHALPTRCPFSKWCCATVCALGGWVGFCLTPLSHARMRPGCKA